MERDKAAAAHQAQRVETALAVRRHTGAPACLWAWHGMGWMGRGMGHTRSSGATQRLLVLCNAASLSYPPSSYLK